jgi:hypothetical protein
MFYLQDTFHRPSSNASWAVSIKSTAKENVYAASLMLVHIIQENYKRSCQYLEL